MAFADHLKSFQPACAVFDTGTQRFQCIDCRFQQDLIVIDDQNIQCRKHHVFSLPVGNRKIQSHCKGRPHSLLTLTVDSAVHQIDHLLCDRKAESGPLNTVHPAVRLT